MSHEQRDAPHEVQWTINPTEDVEDLLAAVEEKAHEHGLEITTVASEGNPADVLVIGNKGMQRRLLGSVPNSVAHRAPCSVVVVKTT